MAGRGETGPDEVRELVGEQAAAAVEFVGGISDDEKAALLASVDVYCGPQTGGESFGIVLVEAMSAGATVVASDLGAFSRVLDDGEAGVLFRTGDSADLAETLVRVLHDPELRARVSAHALDGRPPVRLGDRHRPGARGLRDGRRRTARPRRGGPVVRPRCAPDRDASRAG